MSETEQDTSQVVVQTYVPAYQRDRWDDHADELDMSRSEFVRTMVQAGRRGFGAGNEVTDNESETITEPEAPSTGSEPTMKEDILSALEDGPVSWDDLVRTVVGDIESQVESALKELEDAGELRYSGPQGGYVRTGGTEE